MTKLSLHTIYKIGKRTQSKSKIFLKSNASAGATISRYDFRIGWLAFIYFLMAFKQGISIDHETLVTNQVNNLWDWKKSLKESFPQKLLYSLYYQVWCLESSHKIGLVDPSFGLKGSTFPVLFKIFVTIY